MALLITDECINCDICEPECPNDAIYMGAEIYEIDPNKCTECVGHFDEPQCQQVCPVSCIPFNPAWRESPEQLMAKYERLQAELPAAKTYAFLSRRRSARPSFTNCSTLCADLSTAHGFHGGRRCK